MKTLISLILVSFYPQLTFSKAKESKFPANHDPAFTSCRATAMTTCIKVAPNGEPYTVSYVTTVYGWSQGASLASVCAAAQNAASQANLNACNN
jgi:hypothetical protein